MLPFLFLLIASELGNAHHEKEKECPATGVFMNNAASIIYFISVEKSPFPVPFLRNSSETVEKQLLDVVKDGSQTSTAMQEKLQKWLNSQEPAVKDEFEEREKKILEGQAKVFAEIQSTTNLTDTEKDALEKMKAIGAKTDIPVKEQVDQIKATLKALSEEQQKKIHEFLVDAIHQFMPEHLHPEQ